MRSQDIPLSGPVILAKAADFALQLDYDDFAASDGWLHRFRERYDLVFRAVSGEMNAVNMETCEGWRSEVLQGYMEKYSPQDIFNANETALFFKLLLAKTITYKGDKCTGGKKSKERITVMLVANMTGTEKLLLFVIGKSRNPRCFKNIWSLPSDYAANKKAWMTGELFAQWLGKLDKKFERCGRKVLLLVDNCSAHKVDVETKAIELAFLPANTTAVLQPMDQGIIKNLKSFYRRQMLERIILCNNYQVMLLSALHMLVRVWEQVTALTIANCYRHCGFSTEALQADEPPVLEHGVTAPMADVLEDVCFADYVDVDSSAVVCGALTDDDITCQVRSAEPVAASDDDEEEDEAPVRPSAAEVMARLNAARLF
ncbi:tigger transposable element-derived protein 4 [Rhipicephalus sanguineus]|uniref:tigger transposable element-derived protein 4 n=1 Tax=Rhipicephalus sanguineus TaxID=34632 RepID=UPI0018936949|nr:tigger transposable element-derived protein 4 [Rhipicephalus sanguineus]